MLAYHCTAKQYCKSNCTIQNISSWPQFFNLSSKTLCLSRLLPTQGFMNFLNFSIAMFQLPIPFSAWSMARLWDWLHHPVCFRSVVVITLASHARGPGFETQRKQCKEGWFWRTLPYKTLRLLYKLFKGISYGFAWSRVRRRGSSRVEFHSAMHFLFSL